MSKKKQITPDDFGIDGWYVDLTTEKNKLASSSHTIKLVFDKHHGIDKFHSEFEFLSSHCPSEEKYFKKSLTSIDLPMKQKGAYYYLSIADRSNPANKYISSTFYIKEAKNKYLTDPIFKGWFDYAIRVSVDERIINGILQVKPKELEIEQIDESISTYIPETSKIEDALESVETAALNYDEQILVRSFDHTHDFDDPEITNHLT